MKHYLTEWLSWFKNSSSSSINVCVGWISPSKSEKFDKDEVELWLWGVVGEEEEIFFAISGNRGIRSFNFGDLGGCRLEFLSLFLESHPDIMASIVGKSELLLGLSEASGLTEPLLWNGGIGASNEGAVFRRAMVGGGRLWAPTLGMVFNPAVVLWASAHAEPRRWEAMILDFKFRSRRLQLINSINRPTVDRKTDSTRLNCVLKKRNIFLKQAIFSFRR